MDSPGIKVLGQGLEGLCVFKLGPSILFGMPSTTIANAQEHLIAGFSSHG